MMAMFGNRQPATGFGATGLDLAIGPDPYAGSRPQHGGFFSPGGAGRTIAGYIGDALLSASGNKPIYGPAVSAQRDAQAELQKAIEIQKYKSMYPDPTGTMQNAAAGGLVPGTPEYQKWVLDNGGRPQQFYVLGNPESGQTIVNANGAGGVMPSSSPPADAVARLKQNPGEAAQFDAIFGAGSAQRVLGGM